MNRRLFPHPRAQAAFALLSLADLLLTWLILCRSDAYEANPLARWCLLSLGWVGLAAYKASTVFVVFVAVLILSRSRPEVSAGLLWFGCSAVGAVVLYSAMLCCPGLLRCRPDPATLARECAEVNRAWDERDRLRRMYHRRLQTLSAALAVGKGSLREAVRQLEDMEYVKDSKWRRRVAERRPDLSPRQYIALGVCFHAFTWRKARRQPIGPLANQVEVELAAMGLELSDVDD